MRYATTFNKLCAHANAFVAGQGLLYIYTNYETMYFFALMTSK